MRLDEFAVVSLDFYYAAFEGAAGTAQYLEFLG